jgi:hypothetical protein
MGCRKGNILGRKVMEKIAKGGVGVEWMGGGSGAKHSHY